MCASEADVIPYITPSHALSQATPCKHAFVEADSAGWNCQWTCSSTQPTSPSYLSLLQPVVGPEFSRTQRTFPQNSSFLDIYQLACLLSSPQDQHPQAETLASLRLQPSLLTPKAKTIGTGTKPAPGRRRQGCNQSLCRGQPNHLPAF